MMHVPPGARYVFACCLIACAVGRVATLPGLAGLKQHLTVDDGYVMQGLDDAYQDDMIKNLKEYEVVVPHRVEPGGQHLDKSHDHYLHRGKRDLYSSEHLSNLAYKFNIGSNEFLLDLKPYSSFMAPNMIVQYLDYNRTWTKDASDWKHCFYSGTVNKDSGSKATLSICEHLHGNFRILGEHYLIEPHPDHVNRTQGDIPHIVYKWDSLPQFKNKKNESQTCQTQVADSNKENWTDTESHNATRQESEGHSRHKRSVSRERYVETLVMADITMVKYHGDRLETYLLTLMAIVAELYRDASIGNSIHVVVVRLLMLQSDKEGPKISSNAARTLKEFCHWQDQRNFGDDNHGLHHDTAILLTRQDICRSSNKCDTLGLAEVGTMCNKKKSCSITEDNGVSAAYTMAHELGHVFNLPHDTDFRCKKFEDQRNGIYHMMAPTLYQGTKPWNWSQCSRAILTEFLDAGYGDCLNDKPGSMNYIDKMAMVSLVLPGETYNLNEQCEMVYGKGTRICPYNPSSICEDLWCLDTNGACMTEHMPWADGTPCGYPNKVCLKGSCSYRQDREVVDGGWSQWGDWGACSRTCGGGIKRSSRTCSNPMPENGGKYCLGDRMKYMSCNYNIECPTNTRDFREVQCAKQNPRLQSKAIPSNVQWVPKYAGIHYSDRCKLFCRIAGTNAFFLLKSKVEDGTNCGPDTFDVCVNGKCRSAGCDHIMGSNKTLDICGNCNGDNSTCKHINDYYRHKVYYGYNPVIKIPSGSSEIRITQNGHRGRVDDNYLAITNSEGKFLLNGNMVVTLFRKTIPVKGSVIEYSGSDQVTEYLNCTKRIQEDINVYVLTVGNVLPPNITYEYITSLRTPRFRYINTGPYGLCNRMCQGVRSREIVCVRTDDGTHVRDEHCEGQPKPKKITHACATHCTLQWRVVDEGICPSRCGKAIQVRKVRCMKQERSKAERPVADSYCYHVKNRPPEKIACQGKCMDTSWRYGEWAKCSKSCNNGYQRRSAVCMDAHQRKLPPDECVHEKPHLIQKCNPQPCPAWHTGNWSGCSVTCGNGLRYRRLSCILEGKKISKALCDGKTEPISELKCNLGDCPIWVPRTWGQCSVTCGLGIQTRRVDCTATDGVLLEDTECNAAQQPLGQQECYMPACPTVPMLTTPTMSAAEMADVKATWRTGSWTKCSKTCGAGLKRRYVSCRENEEGRIANDTECDPESKPSLTEPCFVKPCGQWRTGHWTECSVTCGDGVMKRYVACIVPKKKKVPTATLR